MKTNAMINIIFNNIIFLTKQSIVVFVVVVIARLLLNKTPKKYCYYLWLIFFIKLLIPYININGPSIFKLTKNINVNEYIPLTSLEGNAVNQEINNFQNINNSTNIFIYIWIFGILIFFLYIIISHSLIKRKIIFATKYQDYKDVKTIDNINIPFVYGVIKPTIYLPDFLNKQEIDQILIHERIHINRKDNIIKYLITFILMIYWFNPLAWFSYYQMIVDMEMSCDETAIIEYGLDRKEYSNNLLKFANINNLYDIGFSQGNLKKRIINIMNCKKYKEHISLICAVLIVVVCFILFTKINNNNIDKLNNAIQNSSINDSAINYSNLENLTYYDFAKQDIKIQNYYLTYIKEIGDCLTKIDLKKVNEKDVEGAYVFTLKLRYKNQDYKLIKRYVYPDKTYLVVSVDNETECYFLNPDSSKKLADIILNSSNYPFNHISLLEYYENDRK